MKINRPNSFSFASFALCRKAGLDENATGVLPEDFKLAVAQYCVRKFCRKWRLEKREWKRLAPFALTAMKTIKLDSSKSFSSQTRALFNRCSVAMDREWRRNRRWYRCNLNYKDADVDATLIQNVQSYRHEDFEEFENAEFIQYIERNIMPTLPQALQDVYTLAMKGYNFNQIAAKRDTSRQAACDSYYRIVKKIRDRVNPAEIES